MDENRMHHWQTALKYGAAAAAAVWALGFGVLLVLSEVVGVGRGLPGLFSYLSATWGDGVTSLYVDGAAVGHKEYNGELIMPPGTPWYFGSDHTGGARGASSLIPVYKVFPRSLSADEVSALVAQTRPAQ